MSTQVYDITERNKQVDEFEAMLLTECEVSDAPIRSVFVDGMYVREMSVKADSWVTSAIHKTEFIFIVSKGKLIVSMDEGEEVVIEAPYMGISKPYSRRVAYIVEDTIWTTFHPNPDNETEEEIEARIIEPHTNELITEKLREKMLSVVREKKTISLIPENY